MREIKFKKEDKIKAIAEIISLLDSLDDNKTYCLTVKEDRIKRSLNANAYAWVLLDKLAEKLNIAKTDLYKSYIKEIGGNNTIVCCIDKAVDKLRDNWSSNGIGWITDTLQSKIEGCTNVILYYGSSTYDNKQMHRLIEMIVADCKMHDIETLTPRELETMLNEWGNNEQI